MGKIKTIGLIAPCGNIRDLEKINQKIELLKKHFKIKKFYDENKSLNYLSDTIENRVKYLESAFLDSDVDLVLCVRGGYGAIQIVDKINYDLIKDIKKDKFFIGSSDATILLAALNKKTNVKCFHGLMISNGFVENLEKNISIIENDIFNINLEPIIKGSAQGVLYGGNLSTLVSLFSGDYFLSKEDIILFLEDLNEPLYKVDKMLFEIYRNKKLKEKIKGIIFGDFYFEKEEILPLIKQYSNLFNVPTYLTFDITHKENNITLPFGKFVKIG